MEVSARIKKKKECAEEMQLGERIFCLKLTLQLIEGGRMQRFHKEGKELIINQIKKLKQSNTRKA